MRPIDTPFYKHFCICAAALFLIGFAFTAAADETALAEEDVSTNSGFAYGRWEGALSSGVFFSPFIANYERPTINYALTAVQCGYMLSDVKGKGFLRGNWEMVGEGFGAAIWEGSGSYIAGMTIWGRYNFVPTKSRFVPFVEFGLGLTSTDIDREIVGQPFNFNIDVGIGTRYFVSEKWALTLEYRYQHISNANTGEHNLGINANGPMLGVTYLF